MNLENIRTLADFLENAETNSAYLQLKEKYPHGIPLSYASKLAFPECFTVSVEHDSDFGMLVIVTETTIKNVSRYDALQYHLGMTGEEYKSIFDVMRPPSSFKAVAHRLNMLIERFSHD